MANKSNKTRFNVTQPNSRQYQAPTGGGNLGELPSSFQDPRNAIAARQAEASVNNCLGAGWGTVGGPAQAAGNPPGVGKIPSGATGLFPGKEQKKGR